MSKFEMIVGAIEQINSKEAFAKWLWEALEPIYTRSFSRNDNRCVRILQQDAPFLALILIYKEYVPDEKKLMFRQAIGVALQEHGNDRDKVSLSILEDFIYLITDIKAAEALDSLLLVSKGFFKDNQSDLSYSALVAFKSLSPLPQIYGLMTDLIKSENFDDGYLFEAIKILIECNPSEACKIVSDLKPRLVELRQRCRNLGGNEWSEFRKGANDCAKHISALRNDIIADEIAAYAIRRLAME